MIRGRGRKKKDIPYNEEYVKEFISKMFVVEKEIAILQEDKAMIRDQYKQKVNSKLINSIIAMVKHKIKMQKQKASPETVEEIEKIVLDNIGSLVG